MTDEDRIACWAVGARSRNDLQLLVADAEKLVSLTAPGSHDPLEVQARWKEIDRLAAQIRRDAADSVACGTYAPEIDERGGVVFRSSGPLPPHSWVVAWQTYGERLFKTADPHARAVALAHEIPRVIETMGWQADKTPRPGGSPPQGEVTLKLGPKGNYLFTPQTEEDLETAKHLEQFFSGELKQESGVEVGGSASRREGTLQPQLSDALEHLRGVLAAVTVGSETKVSISYNEQARVLEVAGYADPYKGQTWQVRLTPNYTAQNQREIADYVRHYEDSIAEEVRRLIPRKRRMSGWSVEFYTTHPGVQYAEHVGVGPPDSGYMLPDYHPEDTYTPPDFNARPAKPLFG